MVKKTQNQEEQSEARSQRTFSKTHKIIAGIVIALIIIIAAVLVWLYTGSLSSTKQKVFSAIPLPVAIVEINPISSTQLFDRLDLAKEVLKASGQTNDDLENQILTQLIETKKVEILARKNNLYVSADEVEASYKAVLAQFPGGNEDQFKQELKDTYGMDLGTFKNEVLHQTLLQEKLSKWFNEQESLNNDSYKKARELIAQLDGGKSFEAVAIEYNQDPSSKDFAGDSGFVAYSQLLPEFQAGVKDLAIGDKKLIVSRYGLHIIKVLAIEEKDGEKNFNLQQIFVKPGDFLKWFSEQSTQIRSFKLL